MAPPRKIHRILEDGTEVTQCSKCKEEKPLTEFYVNKQTPTGLSCSCKVCDRARVKEYRKNRKEKKKAGTFDAEVEMRKKEKEERNLPENVEARKLKKKEDQKIFNKNYVEAHRDEIQQKKDNKSEEQYIKCVLQNLKLQDIKLGREFDIDQEYINRLIAEQDNRCKYSDLEMVWRPKAGPFQGSIDRIDSTKGHIKGNIELTLMCVNYLRCNLMPGEFKFLLENINDTSLAEDVPEKIGFSKKFYWHTISRRRRIKKYSERKFILQSN